MFKKLFLQKTITNILFLLLGILLIALDGQILANILFILIGVFILISNLNEFILCTKNLKYKAPTAISQFLITLASIILGLLIIILREKISSAIGIMLLIVFILELFLDKQNFLNSFLSHISLLIFAIVLMVFGFGGIINVLCTVIGVLLIIFSIISLINSLFLLRR